MTCIAEKQSLKCMKNHLCTVTQKLKSLNQNLQQKPAVLLYPTVLKFWKILKIWTDKSFRKNDPSLYCKNTQQHHPQMQGRPAHTTIPTQVAENHLERYSN